MNGNVKTGVAVVGGYLLGRTKKAKTAIGLGMFLAGRKLSFDPSQIGKLVANSPVLGSLNDQVRKELVEATKTAATGALTQRATGLADSLQERTRALNDPPKGDDGSGQDEDAGEDASSAADHGEDESGEKQAPARKAAAKTASAKTSSAKSAATKGTSDAGRGGGSGTSSKARTASSNRTKSASGTATKNASKAGRTAASAARKPRGGGRNG